MKNLYFLSLTSYFLLLYFQDVNYLIVRFNNLLNHHLFLLQPLLFTVTWYYMAFAVVA